MRAAAAMLALLLLAGCHAPRFTGVDRVVRTQKYEIRTDAGAEIEGSIAPLLDRIAARLEARLPAVPSPTAGVAVEPYRAVIFGKREDFDQYRIVHGADDHAHAFHCKFGGEIVLPAESVLRHDAPSLHLLAHEVTHQVLQRAGGERPAYEAEGAAELWPIRSVRPDDLPEPARAAWAWLGALRELRAVIHASLRGLYGKPFVRGPEEVAWGDDDYAMHLALALYLEAKGSSALPDDPVFAAWVREQAISRLEAGGAPEAAPLAHLLREGKVQTRTAAREAVARAYHAVLAPAFTMEQLDLDALEENDGGT